MSRPILRPVDETGDNATETIGAFIANEASALSPPTQERYAAVAAALFAFMDTVDVRPRLGEELARHLEAERERLGPGAFLPTLGVVSLLRVLPAFLEDPWLPPAGAQRGSHRAVVERLLVFLRRRALIGSDARDDVAKVRRAIGTARARDYGWRPRGGDEVVTEEIIHVTVGLPSRILDPLLAQVERGVHDSLADAVVGRLEPHDDPWRWGEPGWDGWDAYGR